MSILDFNFIIYLLSYMSVEFLEIDGFTVNDIGEFSDLPFPEGNNAQKLSKKGRIQENGLV